MESKWRALLISLMIINIARADVICKFGESLCGFEPDSNLITRPCDTQGGNDEPVQALCITLVRGPSIREGVLLSPLITATRENKCIALVGQQIVGMYGVGLMYTANGKQSQKSFFTGYPIGSGKTTLTQLEIPGSVTGFKLTYKKLFPRPLPEVPIVSLKVYTCSGDETVEWSPLSTQPSETTTTTTTPQTTTPTTTAPTAAPTTTISTAAPPPTTTTPTTTALMTTTAFALTVTQATTKNIQTSQVPTTTAPPIIVTTLGLPSTKSKTVSLPIHCPSPTAGDLCGLKPNTKIDQSICPNEPGTNRQPSVGVCIRPKPRQRSASLSYTQIPLTSKNKCLLLTLAIRKGNYGLSVKYQPNGVQSLVNGIVESKSRLASYNVTLPGASTMFSLEYQVLLSIRDIPMIPYIRLISWSLDFCENPAPSQQLTQDPMPSTQTSIRLFRTQRGTQTLPQWTTQLPSVTLGRLQSSSQTLSQTITQTRSQSTAPTQRLLKTTHSEPSTALQTVQLASPTKTPTTTQAQTLSTTKTIPQSIKQGAKQLTTPPPALSSTQLTIQAIIGSATQLVTLTRLQTKTEPRGQSTTQLQTTQTPVVSAISRQKLAQRLSTQTQTQSFMLTFKQSGAQMTLTSTQPKVQSTKLSQTKSAPQKTLSSRKQPTPIPVMLSTVKVLHKISTSDPPMNSRLSSTYPVVSSTTDKVSTIARVKCHTQGRTELRLNSNITTATATVSVKNKMDPTTIDSAAIETTTGSVVADSSTTSLTDLETMDYSSTTTTSHAVSGLNSSTTPLSIYSSNVTTLEHLNTTTTSDGHAVSELSSTTTPLSVNLNVTTLKNLNTTTTSNDIGDFTSALWNTTKTRIVNPALANPTTTIEGPTNLLDEEIAESLGALFIGWLSVGLTGAVLFILITILLFPKVKAIYTRRIETRRENTAGGENVFDNPIYATGANEIA